MSLYRFFKLLTCLQIAKKAGLSTHTTEEAYKAVEKVLASQHSASVRKTRRKSIQQVSLTKFV